MKVIRKRGDTSNILQIFIQDSSSTVGAGLTGLTNASSSLTAYYHRDIDTTATAISLVSMTVGSFTASGFKEIDATNMPGWYQFCPPDAALSATSSPHSVAIQLKGATNMMQCNIEIQLIAADVEDTVRLGLTALPNVASGSAGAIPTTGAGANQLSVSSGAVTIGTGGISASSFAAGAVDATAIAASAIASSEFDQTAADKVWLTAARSLTTVFPLKKNTARAGVQFFMVDSADHVSPKTGLTITSTRSIDGAAFGACANSASEISNGWYTIDLAAADLNGNNIALKFTAAGADQRNMLLATNV